MVARHLAVVLRVVTYIYMCTYSLFVSLLAILYTCVFVCLFVLLFAGFTRMYRSVGRQPNWQAGGATARETDGQSPGTGVSGPTPRF